MEESKEHLSLSEALGIIAIGFAGSVPIALLRAYVLVDIWAMFITPTWAIDAPALPTAYALSCGWTVLTYTGNHGVSDSSKVSLSWAVGRLAWVAVALLLVWGFAAAVHSVWGH